MSNILAAISEDYEEKTGERSYELDRAVNNHGEDTEDILALLNQMGY